MLIADFSASLSSAIALVFLLGEGAYHRLCGQPYVIWFVLPLRRRARVETD